MADRLVAVRLATRKRARANETWKQTIRDAHAHGFSLREIAKEADVTNPRIHQIIRE